MREAAGEGEATARQRELLDTVSDLVFVLTRDGRFHEMNKAAEQSLRSSCRQFCPVKKGKR